MSATLPLASSSMLPRCGRPEADRFGVLTWANRGWQPATLIQTKEDSLRQIANCNMLCIVLTESWKGKEVGSHSENRRIAPKKGAGGWCLWSPSQHHVVQEWESTSATDHGATCLWAILLNWLKFYLNFLPRTARTQSFSCTFSSKLYSLIFFSGASVSCDLTGTRKIWAILSDHTFVNEWWKLHPWKLAWNLNLPHFGKQSYLQTSNHHFSVSTFVFGCRVQRSPRVEVMSRWNFVFLV